MAIDLGEYVEAARAAVSAPGEDLFPASQDEHWINAMANAFWEAFLNGHFKEYREQDGSIIPRDPATPDMTRDQVQLILLYTAYTAVRNQMRGLKTGFRGKAGPTEVETQRSAQLLVAILKDITAQIAEVKKELLKRGQTTPAVWDATIARDEGLIYGDNWWVG